MLRTCKLDRRYNSPTPINGKKTEYRNPYITYLTNLHVIPMSCLCNNLFCIIDAESEEEIELREMLMEQIKDEPATVEYVHNFLTNREEK